MEVALAKPQSDKKSDATYPYNAMPHPNHLPHSGYGGFASNQYGSLGAGYGVGTGFQQVFALICMYVHIVYLLVETISWICTHEQPVIYGRGPMPAGMHMVPMVLPDGQIGYVL